MGLIAPWHVEASQQGSNPCCLHFRQILNHWTTKGVHVVIGYFFSFLFFFLHWLIFNYYIKFSSVQSFSHVQLFVTVWTAARQASLSINQLPELTKIHVHRVGDAIQPSHPLLSPCPPAFNLFQHQGLFQWVSSSHQIAKILEFQLQHQSFQWIYRTDFL